MYDNHYAKKNKEYYEDNYDEFGIFEAIATCDVKFIKERVEKGEYERELLESFLFKTLRLFKKQDDEWSVSNNSDGDSQNKNIPEILEIIQIFIEAGVDVNHLEDNSLETPLIIAAHHNFKEAVALLLELGANPNYQNQQGHSALMYSAFYESFESAEILLRNEDINPNLQNNNGKSFFYHILSGGPISSQFEKTCKVLEIFINEKLGGMKMFEEYLFFDVEAGRLLENDEHKESWKQFEKYMTRVESGKRLKDSIKEKNVDSESDENQLEKSFAR